MTRTIAEVRASWASSLALVSGRSLLSAPALIAFMLLGLGSNLLLDGRATGDPLVPWLTASAIGTSAGLVVILLSRSLLLRPRGPVRDAWVAIGVIAVAAATKTLLTRTIVYWMPQGDTLRPEPQATFWSHVLSFTSFAIAVICLTCAAVTTVRRHRVERALLLAERERLTELRATTLDQLQQAEQRQWLETVTVLDPALAGIRTDLGSAQDADSSARIMDRIGAVIETVVRPLSHSLADSPPMVAIPNSSPRPGSVVQWLRNTVVVPPAIRPVPVTAIAVGVTLVNGMIWRLPLVSLLATLLTNLVVFILLLMVRALWPARWAVMRAGAALVILLAIYSAISLGPGRFVNSVLVEDISARMGPLAGFLRLILLMAVSIVALVNQQRTEVDRGLVEVNGELIREVARMRRELWSAQRRISLALHGSVQSALISAMLLLRDDPTPESRQSVLVRLEQARAAIDAEVEAQDSIKHGLREIVTLWAGSCSISVSFSETYEAAIDEHPGLGACAVEIVREAISNAVRHGGATAVSVVIAEDSSDRVLRITVRDNGDGGTEDAKRGLGTRMLDEVCVRWQRVRHADGLELVAIVA